MHEIGSSGDIEKNNTLWEKMTDLYAFVFAGDMYKATAYGKEMARLAGLSMGDYTRLPLQPVTDAEREQLRKLMTSAGFGL
jgi:dihydrodipicolinate synthase/N-acetylneuraminate lyase